MLVSDRDSQLQLLPETFLRWFAGRGWSPREHQLALLAKARDDRSALLIAPTGAGKTLAGFLPTLVELSAPSPPQGVNARTLVSTGRGVARSRGLRTSAGRFPAAVEGGNRDPKPARLRRKPSHKPGRGRLRDDPERRDTAEAAIFRSFMACRVSFPDSVTAPPQTDSSLADTL